MRRKTHCELCGSPLKEDTLLESSGWRVRYCSYLCYKTDKLLPEVEDDDIFEVPEKIVKIRYELIISGEADPIYKDVFDEEEDDLMRDHGDS